MYEFIKGTLVDKEPGKVVVEAGGIGYKLCIPLNAYTRLPEQRKEVELFLSHIVREESEALFAFIGKEERDLFELLLSISGIGPKTAVAIIGHIEIGAFQQAIAGSDTRLLSKIPGVGKKTAERLVVEMRDKFVGKKGNRAAGLNLPAGNSLAQDAFRALVNLGYAPMEAQKAVKDVLEEKPNEDDLGRLITAALRKI